MKAISRQKFRDAMPALPEFRSPLQFSASLISCILMVMSVTTVIKNISFDLNEEIVTNRKTTMSHNDKELDNYKARRNLTSERRNIFFLAQL